MAFNKQLLRDLRGAAALLEWSGVDMFEAAKRLSDAGLESEALELIRTSLTFREAEAKLNAYADEVTCGLINRRKINN